MRKILVVLAVVAFVGLGLLDILDKKYDTGIAAVCLGIANGLLLGL